MRRAFLPASDATSSSLGLATKLLARGLKAKPGAQIMFDPVEDSDAICHPGDAHRRELEERHGGTEIPHQTIEAVEKACAKSAWRMLVTPAR